MKQTKSEIQYEKHISHIKTLQGKMECAEKISDHIFAVMKQHRIEFKEVDINMVGVGIVLIFHCKFNFRRDSAFIQNMKDLSSAQNFNFYYNEMTHDIFEVRI